MTSMLTQEVAEMSHDQVVQQCIQLTSVARQGFKSHEAFRAFLSVWQCSKARFIHLTYLFYELTNLLLNFLLGTMTFGQLHAAVSKSMLLQAKTVLSARLTCLYLQNLFCCAGKVCKGLQSTQDATCSNHIMNFAHALTHRGDVKENINCNEPKAALADDVLLQPFCWQAYCSAQHNPCRCSSKNACE